METNVNLRVEKGTAEVVEVPMPHPRGDGFVLVEQAYAGICTEQKAYATGYYEAHEDPLRMGHEGCGTIVEVGPGVTGLSEGDRVIVHIGWACGECWVCRNGLTSTNCENLRVASDMEEHNNAPPGSGGGAFNRYRLAPAINVQKIPDSLDFRYARAANCLIGSTYSIVRDFDVGPQTYALVAGVGFIGHAAIANLKHRGATVIALGRNVDRLAIADTPRSRLRSSIRMNPTGSTRFEPSRRMAEGSTLRTSAPDIPTTSARPWTHCDASGS